MKILSFRPYKDAVYEYRATRPLGSLGARFRRSLLRNNETISLEKLAERIKKQGDIWVVKNVVNLETAKWLVSMRDLVGAKLIMDFDDNFYKIPELNAALLHFDKERLLVLASLAEKCDWLTVSTTPLKEEMKNLNPNIAVLPNYINPSEWKHPAKPHKKIRIGWVYNTMHLPDAELVGKALNKVKRVYGDRVEIVLFGGKVNPFTFDVNHVKPVKYKDYPKKLCELGLDIAICPLIDNDYNRSKSNIKWLECSMSGAAVVASNVYPYEKSIEHGVTGFLTTKQWYKYISKLIDDKELRQNIINQAREEIINNYSSNEKWEAFYKCI